MGIFDSIKRNVEASLRREASKAVHNAVKNVTQTVAKGMNRSETFVFEKLPSTVAEL